jgi:DNA-binding GntR family transcriptional regulator
LKNHDTKPLSNTQRAINELRHLIFTGALPAGSDHLESELAERLGMSRTPVREAALTLDGQGLLEMRPRKGVRILPVSVEDMGEIYDVLTELESLAAEQAAKRCKTLRRQSRRWINRWQQAILTLGHWRMTGFTANWFG